MGQALAAESAAAAAVFAEADTALGERISEMCWNGPQAELDQTVNAQPAILATSIAYLAALRDAWREDVVPAFFAGHSMGQYSALVAAGVISLADGMRLVRERGRQMQASSSDGAMAAIIGLADEKLPELVAAGERAGIFTIANRNSPGQVVVSGERAAVEAAVEAARGLGAKRALPLPVSVAAHSPLMASAAENMRRVLEPIAFARPSAPLLANSDARLLETAETCREELVEHLTRGVDWVAAVEAMADAGVTTFIEIGPGKVLTGLIKRIRPEAEAVAVDDPAAPNRLSIPSIATGAPS
jgi:[acyl-carrier-protein] S-malonyltransferase